MIKRTRVRLAAAVAVVGVGLVGAASFAHASTSPFGSLPFGSGSSSNPFGAGDGTRPIVEQLAEEGGTFDTDSSNYSITNQLALALLKARPNSPAKILADGTQALTIFEPQDVAWARLVSRLTKSTAKLSEQQVFDAVLGLGLDKVEQVLLYHVAVGQSIDGDAIRSRTFTLKMANGGTIVTQTQRKLPFVYDQDPSSPAPAIFEQVMNGGNRQLAHGIGEVLIPGSSPNLGSTSVAASLLAQRKVEGPLFQYDIVTDLALAVLAAKPGSPVKVLTQGDQPLTAFLPQDSFWGPFYYDVTRKAPPFGDKALTSAILGLGIDKVDKVLLNHVVVGQTLAATDLAQLSGKSVTTALGQQLKVSGDLFFLNIGLKAGGTVFPVQTSPADLDMNAGNQQIGHGLNGVLVPSGL